jgi:ligand-binding SRPBCC domain-containing protein
MFEFLKIKNMKPHILHYETKLYRPLSEVFDFFSKAENLNEVTPPDLHFNILTPLPIDMKKGALIDYRIKLFGIPFGWRTLISAWEPPYRFVDEQIKGPYKLWHHEHTFEEKDGYVLMIDHVQYLSPGWFLEPIIDKLFVSKQLEYIWNYRAERFKVLFGKKDEVVLK